MNYSYNVISVEDFIRLLDAFSATHFKNHFFVFVVCADNTRLDLLHATECRRARTQRDLPHVRVVVVFRSVEPIRRRRIADFGEELVVDLHEDECRVNVVECLKGQLLCVPLTFYQRAELVSITAFMRKIFEQSEYGLIRIMC